MIVHWLRLDIRIGGRAGGFSRPLQDAFWSEQLGLCVGGRRGGLQASCSPIHDWAAGGTWSLTLRAGDGPQAARR